MNRILFLCLLFASHLTSGQITIQGRVLDSATHEPVPYCNINIFESEIGTVSNENGYFYLESNQIGELCISNVAYIEKRVPIHQNTDLGTIYLTARVIQLEAANIMLPFKCKTIQSGIYKKSFIDPYRFSVAGKRAGDKVGLYIKNPCKKSERATIKSLFYYIIDPSDMGYLFRVQVYDATGKLRNLPNAPGNALIPDNVVMRKPQTDGWIEVDVSKYGIQVPEEGIYVAIEFLENAPCDALNAHESRLAELYHTIFDLDTVKMKKELEKYLQGNHKETLHSGEIRKVSKKELELLKTHQQISKNDFIHVLYSKYDNKTYRGVTSAGYTWYHRPFDPGTVIENPCIYATFEICK
jgi:hypothetical protein